MSYAEIDRENIQNLNSNKNIQKYKYILYTIGLLNIFFVYKGDDLYG